MHLLCTVNWKREKLSCFISLKFWKISDLVTVRDVVQLMSFNV